jgi:hypothetical protein
MTHDGLMKQLKRVRDDHGMVHGVTFLANRVDTGEAIERTWCGIRLEGIPKTDEEVTCMACIAKRPQ